jgi:hypothetical protein
VGGVTQRFGRTYHDYCRTRRLDQRTETRGCSRLSRPGLIGDSSTLAGAVRRSNVDRVVAADEMPNFPHLEPDKIGNYALAKIKEALIAVTGPQRSGVGAV